MIIAAHVLVILLIAIVCVKVFVNVALPVSLAMHKYDKPFSYPFLVEIIPWVAAIGIAWIAQLGGWLAYWNIAVLGSLLIVVSYVFFLVPALTALFSRSKGGR